MKRSFIVSLISVVLASLMLQLSPAASAEDSQQSRLEQSSEEDGVSSFDDQTIEDVICDFLASYEIEDYNAALGYYNTVTGEEYYYNADKYMDAASMYKVPLNMIFAERVANRELDADGELAGIPYKYLLEDTIVNSSNEKAAIMWELLGGYQNFRRLIAPYMGEDPDEVDWMFYVNNYFTPRQVIHCLNLLYTEQERFPNVIDTMLKAEPDNYFRRDEQRFEIAHKYGFNIENEVLHMNDSAIVYTTDPILIVLFTSGVWNAYDFMADFCTLMCDYTEYKYEQLMEEQAQQDAMTEEEETQAQEIPVEDNIEIEAEANDVEIDSEYDDNYDSKEESDTSEADTETLNRAIVAAAAAGLVAVLSLFSIFKQAKMKKFIGIIGYSLLLAAAAVLLLWLILVIV